MDSPRIAVAMLDCGRGARRRTPRGPTFRLPRWLLWITGARLRA
jgi:hypothetical protein